jgi:DNA-binding IclR family transcriptional regulator
MARIKIAPPIHQREHASQRPRPALARALNVLETVAATSGAMALTDIAQQLALPQATAFRLCQRLEHDGYLVRTSGSRKYAIGARLMRLGLDIVRIGGPTSLRHKILQELVEEIGETCNLTALANSEVVYLDRVETRWPLRLALEPGSRVPLHCTSSGKLFLALMPQEAQTSILNTIKLTASTPKTITNRYDLAKELKKIARQCYSTDNEEFLTGLNCVAVPINDKHGKTIAAVACHAPIVRVDKRKAILLVPFLQKAAARLVKTFESD